MSSSRSVQTALIAVPSIIITIAGLKAASDLIVILLLSVFIAIISVGAIGRFERLGMNKTVALLVTVAIMIIAFSIVGIIVSNAINAFNARLDFYTLQLQLQLKSLITMLNSWGITISQESLFEKLRSTNYMEYFALFFQGLQSVITDSFMIILIVIFMITGRDIFMLKIEQAFPVTVQAMLREFFTQINAYMLIKTWISLLTGAFVGIGMYLLDVDFPLLWGVMAFLLNFIPNIGSLIAGIPPVVLAFIQFGPFEALIAVGIIVFVNTVVGMGIEPKATGKGLGLSSLVVLLSLIFWGWIFGPIGMLLSVPLTIMLKLLFLMSETTRPIAIMLGDGTNNR
ncbi:MAG TPA: AI-2E family transporter [Helicobacteraceae bacterium]|nr:AI-2E family transporter [Helicobacteraceae bacterium]